MTQVLVEDLIELLKKENPKRVIVMKHGDEFTPFSSMGTGAYKAGSTWSGEMGLEALTEADRKAGYTEEDVIDDGVPALALYGVH